MSAAWRFFLDADGKWHWETSQSNSITPARSARGYETLEECQEEAKASGYQYETFGTPLPRTPAVRHTMR
jgi:hypothetical protein